MKILQSILSILKSKYFIALSLFIIWMMFFDLKDWQLIHHRRTKLFELQKSEARFENLIQNSRNQLHLLKSNAESIEKYARENYLMKKDNEDLFIVNPRGN